MSSRTTTKLYPRYCGTISTISAGSGWKCTSLGTTVPTDSEKFTLVTGFAFKRVIDSLIRVRWLSFRLAETLTLEEGCWVVLACLFAGLPARHCCWDLRCWRCCSQAGSDWLP